METVSKDVASLELLAEVRRIAASGHADLGGDCPVPKAFLMASLALRFGLRNYLEIGVHRGRSFLPVSAAIEGRAGRAYRLEADDQRAVRTHDLPSPIDMLHVDGYLDARHVTRDVVSWVSLVRDGGIVVLDEIDWNSLGAGTNGRRQSLELLFTVGRLAVFRKGTSKGRPSEVEILRLRLLYSLAENLEPPSIPRDAATDIVTRRPVVSVIVLAYNQERYVAECLAGILAQQGDFRLELIVGDDGSGDGTMDVIQRYLKAIPHGSVDVKVLPSDENLGISRNLERCLRACTGDYVAICEADDYWIDPNKLQAQVDFLRSHPGCALCFNDLYIYAEDTDEFLPFDAQQQHPAQRLTTKDLIQDYFIGNISCCMYDARHLAPLPASLFALFIGDWMWNIYYSRFGDIGHLTRKMSVYRRHRGGAWSGKPPGEKARLLHRYIDEYNHYLDYEYDALFSACQRKLVAAHLDEFDTLQCDLAILDDVFPHPLSAFRLQEFSTYLREFPRARVYSTGQGLRLLGHTPLDQLISDFKRRHPDHAKQLEPLQEDTPLQARLIYVVFLGNAYANLTRIEAVRTPFVLCLYPGGSFRLDDPRSDWMLRRVTSSPCFRRVVVTQQITYDYLIANGFCSPEQIEFVFGIVTPPAGGGVEFPVKRRFGSDKDTLDICFVAHKYTVRGVDKGYDVFVDVARRLHQRHGNVRFHVVGGFDEQDIDVTTLGDRITFYGPRPTEWFDDFYRDKDLILCPNRPSAGAFDGFPTGTCVDAGLRRTAIFCTDPLELNTHFESGAEIVIVPHDAEKTAAIIEEYHRDPGRLAEIADRGYRKIRQLYGLEVQMGPRLALLRRELEVAEGSRAAISAALDRRRPPEAARRLFAGSRELMVRLGVALVRSSPSKLRDRTRWTLRTMRSNPQCVRAIRRFCPESLLRFYRRVRDAS